MKNFIKNFFDIKFWKFIMVGVINTLVGEGIILVLLNPVGWKNFDWGTGTASFIGVVVGSVVSYFLNKHFTFKNKEKGWKPLFRFALIITVCMLIRVVVSTLVSNGCKAASISLMWMDVNTSAANLSWAVGACVFVACNYIGQRFFAFREKKDGSKEAENE